MLVLSRKVGEELIINGDIRVSVVRVRGNRVRIGIEAPRNVLVRREDSTSTAKTPGSKPQPPLCSASGCRG